ncbi:hypothetical protein WA026_015886 [Henosepilachna vigintioctopunctata]|uniref:Uncharacterized protein n=1 Tax=Henosepilachna vigintioctopunctata TaxID=420089 RepID=A0AAW1UT84_9CUCU
MRIDGYKWVNIENSFEKQLNLHFKNVYPDMDGLNVFPTHLEISTESSKNTFNSVGVYFINASRKQENEISEEKTGGQLKPVRNMNSREKRQKRKQWRIDSSVHRKKKENLRKKLSILMSDTLPDSPVSSIEPAPQNNDINRDALVTRRRR